MENQNKLIFIVEDSEIISELMERVITNKGGYTTMIFSSGEDMLEKLPYHSPAGIFLDYYLDPFKKGNMNGEDLLKTMQIQQSIVPVVMVTGLDHYVKLERLKYLNVKKIINKDCIDVFAEIEQALLLMI